MSDQLTAVHTSAKAVFDSRRAMLVSGSVATPYTPPVDMTASGLPKLLKDISDRMQGVLSVDNKIAAETEKAYEESALTINLARDHILADEDRLARFAFHGDYLDNGLHEATDKNDTDGFLAGNIKKVGI